MEKTKCSQCGCELKGVECVTPVRTAKGFLIDTEGLPLCKPCWRKAFKEMFKEMYGMSVPEVSISKGEKKVKGEV